ncbi:MAG: ATP-binding protein [Cyanobacteria bacterium]|nr:ATP-binding protein [Cyanobacteriota bacterium]MDA0866428.1 ATP-binding protein [Cyanobacteriota bacterium]
MGASHPRSFRRILVLRLLLLGLPVLLLGQYVTLRKGRTSLLETARQNVTSSAVRKADFLGQNLALLQSNLQTLSQTNAFSTGDVAATTAAIQQFSAQIPRVETCIQLYEGTSATVALSTCTTPLSLPLGDLPWATARSAPTQVSFYLASVQSATGAEAESERPQDAVPIEAVMAVPVYRPEGQLRYTMGLKARFTQLADTGARSLVGYTVVMDETGSLQIHPNAAMVGQSITQMEGRDRLQAIQRNTQTGHSGILHLFSFLPNHPEWLAGYAPLEVAIAPGQSQTWTVMAVVPLDHALQGLSDIRYTLLLFTLGLLAGQILLVLYLTQQLSKPVERLCAYAQEIQDLSHFKAVPQNLRIWEFDHLAKAFNRMLTRLEQRSREIQHAWQEAQMANQLKSEFLANTSHELRTPLNAIIGCIRLVRDDCCDSEEEAQEFLDRADQAAIHLLGIINDILNIAKIESGTLEIHLEPVNLQQLIAEVLALQTVQAQTKGIELVSAALPEPLWVEADAPKLKQVILNVVYNAIKFTDDGNVTIQTLVEHGENEILGPNEAIRLPQGIDLPTAVPRVLISIHDTGVGVDPKQQAKLFKPFVMADGSTTRRFEGTGLGLAISRNLITLMNGSITLYSEGLGKGTEVVIALPWIDPELDSASTVSGSAAVASVPVEQPPEDRGDMMAAVIPAPLVTQAATGLGPSNESLGDRP